MDKIYQDFENSIKRKHSFRFTPKYVEEFSVRLKPRTFVEIAIKVFEKLDWDFVYQDGNQVEAKRQGDFEKWTHKITVKIDKSGKVEVKSVSLGNEMWDIGKNSLRVKLFIYAFNEELKEYDEAKLAELEKEIEKKDNWDDYVIPEKLPSPKRYIEPQIIIPLIGVILVSTLLGYCFAYLSIEWKYMVFLFEILTGFALGFSMKFLIRLGNFTDWKKLKFIVGLGAILICILNQYFQYYLILNENNYEPIGFLNFIQLRLEHGFKLDKMNLGAYGYIGTWILQVVLIYIITAFKSNMSIVKYCIDRVPQEVIDFALYHFVKEKEEKEVRIELSKMGWKTELQQNMVFEGIGGVLGGQEIRRG
jgi:hypothetical protein